jgi:hypothetical protein
LLHALLVTGPEERAMDEKPIDGRIPEPYDLPERALGGADAVPDTNYVPAAEPGPERRKGGGPAGPAVSAGNGATWAVIAFLVIAAVLVFLLGFGQ